MKFSEKFEGKPNLMAIITRSYLADPRGTENDLIALGETELVASLKIDYQVGRMAENYATLTGKRVLSEPIGLSLGGGVMSPAEPPEICDSCTFGVCDIHEPIVSAPGVSGNVAVVTNTPYRPSRHDG